MYTCLSLSLSVWGCYSSCWDGRQQCFYGRTSRVLEETLVQERERGRRSQLEHFDASFSMLLSSWLNKSGGGGALLLGLLSASFFFRSSSAEGKRIGLTFFFLWGSVSPGGHYRCYLSMCCSPFSSLFSFFFLSLSSFVLFPFRRRRTWRIMRTEARSFPDHRVFLSLLIRRPAMTSSKPEERRGKKHAKRGRAGEVEGREVASKKTFSLSPLRVFGSFLLPRVRRCFLCPFFLSRETLPSFRLVFPCVSRVCLSLLALRRSQIPHPWKPRPVECHLQHPGDAE